MLFENVTLVLPDRLLPGSRLRVRDGLIVAGSGRAGDEIAVDGQGGYLAPGFIDLHVHGALHRDAMEATPAAFAEILRYHAGGGTTSLALTSVAAPLADLWRLLAAARAWQPTAPCARLLGIHLEGPYLAPTKAGAQPAKHLRPPDPSEYQELLTFADVITQMTLAPELPGALPLIAALHEHQIIASGGHSEAWDEDARRAIGAGLSQVTHVFNAMSGARRRGPYRVAGLLEFALSEPALRCEVIADGHHVSPTLLRLLYRAKGPDGIMLVTDATAGAGLPEGAVFRLGDQDGIVRGGVGLTADGAALAGSTSTMIAGVANLVRLAGVPLVEAIRMATWNPACALGRQDRLGSLESGKAADLVLLSRDLEVQATYVAGSRVWLRPD